MLSEARGFHASSASLCVPFLLDNRERWLEAAWQNQSVHRKPRVVGTCPCLKLTLAYIRV